MQGAYFRSDRRVELNVSAAQPHFHEHPTPGRVQMQCVFPSYDASAEIQGTSQRKHDAIPSMQD